MNGYELSRHWFDWCFENPEKVSPNHTALYFFCVEHCNRLGWKEKFGLPTTMAKEAIGIRSYNTYIKTLNELISFGFIIMIEKSKNQYSSNIVALSNFNKTLDKAPDKALDKAMIKHGTKQSEYIKTYNKETNNKEQASTLSETQTQTPEQTELTPENPCRSEIGRELFPGIKEKIALNIHGIDLNETKHFTRLRNTAEFCDYVAKVEKDIKNFKAQINAYIKLCDLNPTYKGSYDTFLSDPSFDTGRWCKHNYIQVLKDTSKNEVTQRR